MRTILVAALIGALLGCVCAGIVGADFNAGLAPFGQKAQAAIEGALLWGTAGLVIGAIVGSSIATVVRAVSRKARHDTLRDAP
jgi:hypothetical protein